MNNFSYRLLIFSALFALPLFSISQNLKCTTHEMTNAILAQFPERKVLLDQLDREAQEYTEAHYGERSGVVKVIPTVIHVIHNYGSENLSKDFILDALDAVNDELRGQNANVATVVSQFQGIVGDTEFELRLAKIDHQGNCTDGITRTVSSQTYSGGEDVKDLINWNGGSRNYLQVWLVKSVESGAGGYTYMPGTTGAESNGIISRADLIQRTLAHEFGHWMNLSHTWGPTNEPEVIENCGFDDSVGDTPNTVGVLGGCNTGQVSCGTLDNVQNHMDYSDCARMFTDGQASRMQSASNSGTGGRSSYWTSSNRNSTGTNDGFSNSCVPNIDFSVDHAAGCEGLEVHFEDNSWGADSDPSWVWNWSFPGGTPSASNDPNPTITYNSAGSYPVTLTITTGAGSDSRTMQNVVVVDATGGGLTGPFLEGMEDSGFPNNTAANSDWSIESPGGLTWQRTAFAFSSGGASVRINLRSITAGDVNGLISPAIDMSNVTTSNAEMTFKLAHANRNSTTHSEKLRVYVSKNCGESWSLRYNVNGDDLNTAGGFVSSSFVVDAGDWREEYVSLGIMAGEEHVLIKFEATSDNQSYLYIDDININPNAGGLGINDAGAITNMRVFPNPINGTSQLEISMMETVNAQISILNVVGQTLNANSRSLTAGVNRISLADESASLAAGIYLIQVRSELGTRTVRFIKD